MPASGTLDAIQYKYFPVDRRFTMLAAIFGIANPISTCLVAFSLIPIVNYLGYYGLWIVFVPMITGYLWALNYTKKLEIKRGAYYNYPDENILEPDTAIKEEDYEYSLGDEYELFKNNCEYKSELLNKLNIITTKKNSQLNIKLIEKAITFAKKWHSTQMRKTGDKPYYFHPLAVAGMVAEYYCKTDVIIASILHDVVEDSDCTVAIIEESFNQRIAQIVDRLTKKRFIEGREVKLSLEQTLKKLQSLNDYEALFIKKMDRMHNLQTIEGLKPEKQRKMVRETNNLFIRLVSIIGDKIGIHGQLHLENEMFKLGRGILIKNKKDDLKK